MGEFLLQPWHARASVAGPDRGGTHVSGDRGRTHGNRRDAGNGCLGAGPAPPGRTAPAELGDARALDGHVLRGRIWHDDIKAAEPVPNELALGWALHYGVGILYGVVFAVFAGAGWLAAPSFLPVWIFALFTIAAGWFLLQPGMGLGWAAARTPAPWKARGMGLVAHTWFGVGMWLVALAV